MSYTVTIKPSGHTFTVNENEFILDAAIHQGIGIPYSCRTGSCGTCLGKILSGSVEYPQGLPITIMEHEHAEGKAVFCNSTTTSDLTIELKEVDTDQLYRPKIYPARVNSLRKLADDVMELSLKLPNEKRMPFRAGQYLEFILRDKTRRAFSMANSPVDDEEMILHIRHVEDGEFTSHVFNEMKEKALLRFEGPHGDFYVRDDTYRSMIFVAGGTGFAPIKSMVEQLISEGDTRPIWLYWGVRTEKDLYRDDLPKKWALQYEHINYISVLSEEKDNSTWEGRTGWVHEAIADDFPDMSIYDVYMAGPPPMIDAGEKQFLAQDLPEHRLFSDSFEFAVKLDNK